jgi:hypothetical protein
MKKPILQRLSKLVIGQSPTLRSGNRGKSFSQFSVHLSGMTYGQVAAILVEMFPAKIRYLHRCVPIIISVAGYFGGYAPISRNIL